MIKTDPWLLPDGIEEILPEQAFPLEKLRRKLLDQFNVCGYELVMPPFIEYLESLMFGIGHDLEMQTFKLTDHLTGHQLGIRADMTPQVARIDAHHYKSDIPTRFCYIGTVLQAKPNKLTVSRSPIQVGAELYGHAGIESDIEIIELMLNMLLASNISGVHLDLGHVGIFRGLGRQAKLEPKQVSRLFEALQRKAQPEIVEILSELKLDKKIHAMIVNLAELCGGKEVLLEAQKVLKNATNEVQIALQSLIKIADAVQRKFPQLPLYFDLGELRGYQYQTGVVFAAYVSNHGQEIARGGRYDDIGKVFGRARPATGFSSDLKTLLSLGSLQTKHVEGILAPSNEDPGLDDKIKELRLAGERVIKTLPKQIGSASDMRCDRVLKKHKTGWVVEKL